MSQNPSGKEAPGKETSIEEQRSFSDDGVDLTLIRWMLSLTPEERLIALQDNIRSLMRLKDGVIKA